MNREQAKQLLPIIQAFADGETIQFKGEFGKWFDVTPWAEPMFRGETEYRIKPKPLEAWAVISNKGVRVDTCDTAASAEKTLCKYAVHGSFPPYRVVHMREVVE